MNHLLVHPFDPGGNKVDPIMPASQMDAVILVVATESNRAPVARNLRDRSADVDGPVVGVVLNRGRFHIPGFLYRRL